MAEISATFAAALAQYREAYAAQNTYWEEYVSPADKACQAAQDAAGRVRDVSAPNPALDATYEAYDAAQTHFDGLVDVTFEATRVLILTKASSIAELAIKLDVGIAEESFDRSIHSGQYLAAIRADAHALAGE
jgi:hypothetical protein